MNNKVTECLEMVFNRYFCHTTELFYDFVVDDSGNAWHHLPTPEQIRASVPNPCGWGTGMEDSAMNGGNAIDGLISAYNLTHDKRLIPVLESIVRGLLRCVSPGNDVGFVSRSISPFDGKSHYIESSRDQYTHLISGLLKFYDHSICNDDFRVLIRKAILEIISKCERDVVAENDFHMLREDGTIGKVNKMWEEIGTHEWSRLPMFYLAAYHVSGDKKYEMLCKKYVAEAVENSVGHKPETMSCYCTLQMQCALKTLLDYSDDAKLKQKITKIMTDNALFGEKSAIEKSREFTRPCHREEIDYRFKRWHENEPRRGGIFNGYNYDNPGQASQPAFYPVREVAEGAMCAALCPDYEISEELFRAVVNMTECIDTKKHSSIYAPLLLPCAYFLCLESMNKNK